MIILTDELLEYLAEQYVNNKENSVTFLQYLDLKIKEIKGDVLNG